MTEQERLQIRAELAQMMGWQHLAKCHLHDDADCWKPPEDDTANWLHWTEPPDPFINAADNRALVEWLAANDEACDRFNVEMQKSVAPYGGFDALTMLAAAPETITLAAAKALGIQEASE